MIGLLRMVSGEESIGIPDTIDWDMRTTVHTADDPQCECLAEYLHSPRAAYSLVVLFTRATLVQRADEKHVDNAVGPIFKVWVYPQNVTAREGPLHYSRGSHRSTYGKLRWIHEMTVPPATDALREPALRMRAEETEYGLEPVLPLLPIPGAEKTLIVADTAGIHHRGWAAPGVERHAYRLRGDNDGGLPRMNPFRELSCRSDRSGATSCDAT